MAEAKKRFKSRAERDEGNYIYIVNEMSGAGCCRTIVDPRYFGNIGRYINHSCSPNLQCVPVHVENMTPHLAMFTLRPISAGEELTFNYGSGDACSSSSRKCLCLSENCTGFIPSE